jgi:hypothetical protein
LRRVASLPTFASAAIPGPNMGLTQRAAGADQAQQ